MLNIAIAGVTGRMGQAIARIVGEAEDVRLVGGIAGSPRSEADARRFHCPRIVAHAQAASVIAAADVLVDVSSAEALAGTLDAHADALAGRALVVGTTGLAATTRAALDRLAGSSAVLEAANFSIGVHVLARLVGQAARLLGADAYDIEIVESHHRGKADAPSGTALLLADAAASARETALADVRRDGRTGATGARPHGEIGIHAVRGGGVVGEHRVLLLGERERIELVHGALDRSVFAAGALHAARWIRGRNPGRYTMADVIGL